MQQSHLFSRPFTDLMHFIVPVAITLLMPLCLMLFVVRAITVCPPTVAHILVGTSLMMRGWGLRLHTHTLVSLSSEGSLILRGCYFVWGLVAVDELR